MASSNFDPGDVPILVSKINAHHIFLAISYLINSFKYFSIIWYTVGNLDREDETITGFDGLYTRQLASARWKNIL